MIFLRKMTMGCQYMIGFAVLVDNLGAGLKPHPLFAQSFVGGVVGGVASMLTIRYLSSAPSVCN